MQSVPVAWLSPREKSCRTKCRAPPQKRKLVPNFVCYYIHRGSLYSQVQCKKHTRCACAAQILYMSNSRVFHTSAGTAKPVTPSPYHCHCIPPCPLDNCSNSLAEEKRRIENRMSTLEEDLEEEQMNSEAALDKTRKAEQQADALSTENSQLQASIQKAESAKSQLEKQVCKLVWYIPV